ncbi:hypothetical protein D1872_196080 [compost metagenome]
MAARFTDILNIVRPNTFLRIGDTWIFWLHTSVKIRLKRCHTRINPQQGRIFMWNKRRAWFNHMSLAFKKLQPFGADFTSFHISSLLIMVSLVPGTGHKKTEKRP